MSLKSLNCFGWEITLFEFSSKFPCINYRSVCKLTKIDFIFNFHALQHFFLVRLRYTIVV